MKINKILLLLFISFFICSCDKDDGVSPEVEETWSGMTNQNLPVSIVVKSFGSTKKITSYSVQYQEINGSSTISGSRHQENSEGIVTVTNNTFLIPLEDGTGGSSYFINGTFEGNILNGAFFIPEINLMSGGIVIISGTYTAQKQ